jgi:FKBP-type peptidyl-prolyl cis-trans isomerase SlyD
MKTQVISFHYTLKDTKGNLLESSQGSDPVLAMSGEGHLIPALEAKMILMQIGEKKQVALSAIDAYGHFQESLILNVPREELPNTDVIKVGSQFQSQLPSGQVQTFVVTAANEKEVKLDGNHPLAGKDLVFDIELLAIREATAEELEHGHAHGGDGHHHH